MEKAALTNKQTNKKKTSRRTYCFIISWRPYIIHLRFLPTKLLNPLNTSHLRTRSVKRAEGSKLERSSAGKSSQAEPELHTNNNTTNSWRDRGPDLNPLHYMCSPTWRMAAHWQCEPLTRVNRVETNGRKTAVCTWTKLMRWEVLPVGPLTHHWTVKVNLYVLKLTNLSKKTDDIRDESFLKSEWKLSYNMSQVCEY